LSFRQPEGFIGFPLQSGLGIKLLSPLFGKSDSFFRITSSMVVQISLIV
jgi:hypothetical protein